MGGVLIYTENNWRGDLCRERKEETSPCGMMERMKRRYFCDFCDFCDFCVIYIYFEEPWTALGRAHRKHGKSQKWKEKNIPLRDDGTDETKISL
jgi:hypothetical protein